MLQLRSRNPVRGGLFIAPTQPPSILLFVFQRREYGQRLELPARRAAGKTKRSVMDRGSPIDRPPLTGLLWPNPPWDVKRRNKNPCKQRKLAPAFLGPNATESAGKLDALHTLRELRRPNHWVFFDFQRKLNIVEQLRKRCHFSATVIQVLPWAGMPRVSGME